MQKTLSKRLRIRPLTALAIAAVLTAGVFLWRGSWAESVLLAEAKTSRWVLNPSDHHNRPSRPVRHITWHWSSLKTAATGTDNFPMTWAADGHQYCMGGDGYGFENREPKKSLILSKVIGSEDGQRYEDLWDGDGKSYGILALGERIYAWRGPGSGIESFAQTWLYAFDFNGRLIEKKQLFDLSDQLCMPAFLQLGKNYQYAFDDWVYSYAIEPLPVQPFSFKWVWQGGWDVLYPARALIGSPLWDVSPGNVWLLRAPRDRLMDRRAYQFFAGLADGKPVWTADTGNKQSVVDLSANGLVSCAYVPWSNTYLLATEHTESFGSNLQILQSKHPWGPWRALGKWHAWGESRGVRPTLFYWNFAPKWFDADGRAVIVYSGLKLNDRYNSMALTFERDE